MAYYLLSVAVFIVCFMLPTFFGRKDALRPSSFILFSFVIPQAIGVMGYWFADLFVFSDDTLLLGAIFNITNGISYCIAYFLGTERNPFGLLFQYLQFPVSQVGGRLKLFVAIFFAAYFGLLAALIWLTGLDPFSAPLWFRIKASHDFGVLYGPYQMLPLYILFFTFFIHFGQRTRGSLVIFGLGLLIVVFHAVFSGARIAMVQAIFCLLALRTLFYQKEISILKASLLGGAFLPFFFLYSIYRLSGSFNLFELINDVDIHTLAEVVLRFTMMFNSLRVVEAYLDGGLKLLYGSSIIDALYMFVPRSIYPSKPLFFNMELHKFFSGASADGPLNFSAGYMMAEAFLNLHLVGIVIYSIVWGLVIAALDRRYQEAKLDVNVAAGFMLLYGTTFHCLTFITVGIYSAFTQFAVIAFVLCNILVFVLKVKL